MYYYVSAFAPGMKDWCFLGRVFQLRRCYTKRVDILINFLELTATVLNKFSLQELS
jgi:hypothetical protein